MTDLTSTWGFNTPPPTPILTPSLEFEAFMARVNARLEWGFGLSSLDLPDFDYHSAFEASEDPIHTARRAYSAASGF